MQYRSPLPSGWRPWTRWACAASRRCCTRTSPGWPSRCAAGRVRFAAATPGCMPSGDLLPRAVGRALRRGGARRRRRASSRCTCRSAASIRATSCSTRCGGSSPRPGRRWWCTAAAGPIPGRTPVPARSSDVLAAPPDADRGHRPLRRARVRRAPRPGRALPERAPRHDDGRHRLHERLRPAAATATWPASASCRTASCSAPTSRTSRTRMPSSSTPWSVRAGRRLAAGGRVGQRNPVAGSIGWFGAESHRLARRRHHLRDLPAVVRRLERRRYRRFAWRHSPIWTTCSGSASTRSGSTRASPRRSSTPVTTSPTTCSVAPRYGTNDDLERLVVRPGHAASGCFSTWSPATPRSSMRGSRPSCTDARPARRPLHLGRPRRRARPHDGAPGRADSPWVPSPGPAPRVLPAELLRRPARAELRVRRAARGRAVAGARRRPAAAQRAGAARHHGLLDRARGRRLPRGHGLLVGEGRPRISADAELWRELRAGWPRPTRAVLIPEGNDRTGRRVPTCFDADFFLVIQPGALLAVQQRRRRHPALVPVAAVLLRRRRRRDHLDVHRGVGGGASGPAGPPGDAGHRRP